MKYLNYAGNTREGQSLYTGLRFESVNHTTLNVDLKILYVKIQISHNQVSFIQHGQPRPSYSFKYPVEYSYNVKRYIRD
jgi:hypothetical protein